MFSACIHCTADLGRNEVVEAFPVGSRLAFDPARGRLWVVCRACDRWNLSPLDERWEAIETLERRFTDSRLRVSTDNVGLARLREGLDVIRIGEPQRPEMAAWRYGDQFGRRRKRQLLVTGAVVGSAAAIVGGVMAAGVSVFSFAGVYVNSGLWDTLIHGRGGAKVARIRISDGRVVNVLRRHARMTALLHSHAGDPFRLRLESVEGTHVLQGAEAMRVASAVLPTVNRFGGSRSQVQEAVGLLEEAGSPMETLARVQRRRGARPEDATWYNGAEPVDVRRRSIKPVVGALHTLEPAERLVVEMALHEESERRAMDGELAELEARWREAEEIAAIADNMFDDDAVAARLAELRDRPSPAKD
jgi:hypothetical protein